MANLSKRTITDKNISLFWKFREELLTICRNTPVLDEDFFQPDAMNWNGLNDHPFCKIIPISEISANAPLPSSIRLEIGHFLGNENNNIQHQTTQSSYEIICKVMDECVKEFIKARIEEQEREKVRVKLEEEAERDRIEREEEVESRKRKELGEARYEMKTRNAKKAAEIKEKIAFLQKSLLNDFDKTDFLSVHSSRDADKGKYDTNDGNSAWFHLNYNEIGNISINTEISNIEKLISIRYDVYNHKSFSIEFDNNSTSLEEIIKTICLTTTLIKTQIIIKNYLHYQIYSNEFKNAIILYTKEDDVGNLILGRARNEIEKIRSRNSISVGIDTILDFISESAKEENLTRNQNNGLDYEDLCQKVLLNNGYTATMTKKTGDFGCDILAEKNDLTYAIQCKWSSSKVGIKAVQEAYTSRKYYKADFSVLLTNAPLTAAALELASENGVFVINEKQIDILEKISG